MKQQAGMTLFALGLVVLRPMPALGSQDMERAVGNRDTFTVDVAADCRTFVNGPGRADVSFGSGKLFRAGTLLSGPATNDPIESVNGSAPIGDWTTRGQNAFPFPPEIAASYSSTPTFYATQYYMLNGGRTALIAEAYAFFQGQTALGGLAAVTGGIGRFRGATGDTAVTILGTNVTGCPNFRVQSIENLPIMVEQTIRRPPCKAVIIITERCSGSCGVDPDASPTGRDQHCSSSLLELVSALSTNMSAH
jgi:hypothetical protein